MIFPVLENLNTGFDVYKGIKVLIIFPYSRVQYQKSVSFFYCFRLFGRKLIGVVDYVFIAFILNSMPPNKPYSICLKKTFIDRNMQKWFIASQ